MRHLSFVLLFAIAACGGSGGAAQPDAFVSTCGQPGDPGNELGVGKFCNTFDDCSGNQNSTLCSNIGDETTHFCTFICSSTGAPDQCGTGAQCVCQGTCGCTPTVCLQ